MFFPEYTTERIKVSPPILQNKWCCGDTTYLLESIFLWPANNHFDCIKYIAGSGNFKSGWYFYDGMFGFDDVKVKTLGTRILILPTLCPRTATSFPRLVLDSLVSRCHKWFYWDTTPVTRRQRLQISTFQSTELSLLS